MKSIFKFLNQHRLELITIFFIFFLALALRLWKIDGYLTFLGDEGRDVRIVRDLITKGDLVFIGPMTSIGNMYLGPLYYYMMAPALWFSGLSPVGPAIMIAFLSTVTVLFAWWVGRTWFNPLTGLLAAFLFAISPVAIIYGRASWNPNPMPFFSLLCIWGIWQVWQNKNFRWLPIVGTSLAFALQMHYLGLLLIPTLVVFWFLTFRQARASVISKKSLLVSTAIALISFLVLMSPLVLFDLKHSGQNLNAFKAFFGNRQTTVNLNPARSDRFLPAIQSIVAELLLGRQLIYSSLTALIIAITFFWAFFGKFKISLKDLKTKKDPALILLLTWIGFAILGLGIYKQHIYAHYFGFLFPAVYLLVGFLLAFLWQQKHFLFKALSIVFLGCLLYHAVYYSPLKQEPNRQLQRTEKVVDLIIKESNEQDFNFGLIAKQNYDESYRYFLENKKARMIRGEERVVDQIFVVCEDGDKCQPEGNSQWQIAVFGPSTIVQAWQIDSIKIYKMVHTK